MKYSLILSLLLSFCFAEQGTSTDKTSKANPGLEQSSAVKKPRSLDDINVGDSFNIVTKSGEKVSGTISSISKAGFSITQESGERLVKFNEITPADCERMNIPEGMEIMFAVTVKIQKDREAAAKKLQAEQKAAKKADAVESTKTDKVTEDPQAKYMNKSGE